MSEAQLKKALDMKVEERKVRGIRV